MSSHAQWKLCWPSCWAFPLIYAPKIKNWGYHLKGIKGISHSKSCLPTTAYVRIRSWTSAEATPWNFVNANKSQKTCVFLFLHLPHTVFSWCSCGPLTPLVKLLEKAWKVQVNILVRNWCYASCVEGGQKVISVMRNQLEEQDNRGHVKTEGEGCECSYCACFSQWHRAPPLMTHTVAEHILQWLMVKGITNAPSINLECQAFSDSTSTAAPTILR